MRCFMPARSMRCFMSVRSIQCFMSARKMRCFIAARSKWCFIPARSMRYFMKARSIRYFMPARSMIYFMTARNMWFGVLCPRKAWKACGAVFIPAKSMWSGVLCRRETCGVHAGEEHAVFFPGKKQVLFYAGEQHVVFYADYKRAFYAGEKDAVFYACKKYVVRCFIPALCMWCGVLCRPKVWSLLCQRQGRESIFYFSTLRISFPHEALAGWRDNGSCATHCRSFTTSTHQLYCYLNAGPICRRVSSKVSGSRFKCWHCIYFFLPGNNASLMDRYADLSFNSPWLWWR